jgi:dephospho-CoA kinase
LTGGIGSGKSAVASRWAEFGALVIVADRSARDAVEPGSPAFAQIAERWPSVLASTGRLDRDLLARIVFEDDAARLELESILHPAVRAIGRAREAEARVGQSIVHVVPLLFEVGFDRECSVTVVVVAPEAARIERVMAREGWVEAAVRVRMLRQIDPAEARRRADIVIENDGDLAALRDAATAVYERFTAR